MASVQSSRPKATGRLADDHEFRSRLSSWSNKHHQDQSKAGIILWLQESYETGYRASMAKEDVYSQYVAHCRQEGTEPLRASMFGKLVHRAFPGLKSSRIGTRGATRHSYKSFRPKAAHGIATSAHTAPSTGASRSAFTFSVNSLPHSLAQLRDHYRPDALYVTSFPGGQRLEEETDGSSSSAELSSSASSPISSSFSLPSECPDEICSSSPKSDWAMHSYPPSVAYHFAAGTAHPGMGTACPFSSSPSSFPSPTLPFDSFAYTSVAFSPYMAGPSPAVSQTYIAAPSSVLPCACDECAPFSVRQSGGPSEHQTFPYSSRYPTTTNYYPSNWSGLRRLPQQVPTADRFRGRHDAQI